MQSQKTRAAQMESKPEPVEIAYIGRSGDPDSHRAPRADERETVITWTDADAGKAVIYTCQPPMIRILRKHPHARLVEEQRSQAGKVTGVEYEIPVACLAILNRPRSSTWKGLVRVGRGGKRVKGSKSPLSGIRNGQSDHPGAGRLQAI